MPTPGPQEARRLVEELNTEQRAEVVLALERLSLGSDDGAAMELMSLAWRCVSPSTSQALKRAGLSMNASELLEMFRQHPAAVVAISRALSPGPQGESALEELSRLAAPWQRPAPVAAPVAPEASAEPDWAQEDFPSGKEPSREWPPDELDWGPARDDEDRKPIGPVSLSRARKERPPRPQARAYSSSAALVFELDTLRPQEGEPVRHTVSIEAARGRGGEGYDWEQKIIFQCTLRELPQVVACLMGWTRELEFRGHGSGQDKRLLMRHQDESIYVKLLQGRHAVSLPVHRDDLYALVLICLRALSANDPDVPVPALLEVIRQLALARKAS